MPESSVRSELVPRCARMVTLSNRYHREVGDRPQRWATCVLRFSSLPCQRLRYSRRELTTDCSRSQLLGLAG
jgi:hypothetical protein